MLDDLDSIDMEEMKTTCRNCRQPGGTMDNPALAVAADADAAARMPLFVANRGVILGCPHEKRLNLLLHCKKHFLKIQRPFTVPQATIANPQLTWTLHRKEEENEDQEVNSLIKFEKEDQSR